MKGIVFTEFIELVENKFGLVTAQKVIDDCQLSTGGAYSAVGTYDHKELFALVQKLSEVENVPIPELLTLYGEYFLSVLASKYPAFFAKNDLFSFLVSIDSYIHPEVLKLYPDAELPSFTPEIVNEKEMNLVYTSSRKMADFAIGLINGSANYYKVKLEVTKIAELNNGEEVHLKLTLN